MEVVLSSHWSIFSVFSDLDRVSIANVASKFGELTENAQSIISLEEIVENFLIKNDSSRTFGSLKKDVQNLNQLKTCLNKIDPDIFSLFTEEENPASLINKRKSLEKNILELEDLLWHISKLSNYQGDISLSDSIQLTTEAKAKLDKWKSALTKLRKARFGFK